MSIVVNSSEFLADPSGYVRKAEKTPVRVVRDGKIVLSFGTFIRKDDEIDYEYDEICPSTGKTTNPWDYDHCLACSGEACFLCGAGCWSNRQDCEHDVVDRHKEFENDS